MFELGGSDRHFAEANLRDKEIIKHIREYVEVMRDEPAHDLIEVQKVYHDLRRMLGDE